MVKKYEVELTADEKKLLRNVLRRTSEPARIVKRCKILLLCNQSKTDAEVAEELSCSASGVATVRKRFSDGGLHAAIYDAPREGAPCKFTDEQLMQIVKLAGTAPPDGRERWTLELLVDESVRRGIVEHISIGRIYELLREHDRLPHLSEK